MSLADLVAVACPEPRRDRRGRFLPMRSRKTPTQYHMRWLNKPGNRAKFNAYRRRWWAARKKA